MPIRETTFAAALACAVMTLVGPTGRARGQSADLVAPTGPRSPEEERKAFHLPEGFEAQLVAAEPQINKPMNLNFDDRGRLWVTSTVEYPFPSPEGTPPRDKVIILDDFAEDGRARKVTTFAEGLNIPIGVLPLAGGREALVHSIPTVSRFIDDDGDGRADRREVAYESYGSRDTHGMTNSFTWGFDGWIYACHGFNNDSKVQGADKQAIAMQSGNVYRMRPDGSRVEYVTHGQVNPFGLAFDPAGNLYSADCHTRPIHALLRGAYYPSFGKPHDGLGFGPEIMTHDHGSTGIAGVVAYAAAHFPLAYRGNLYVGNVVTSRINRDSIQRHGSTGLAIAQPDFMTSDDPWFRPVDLKLGPDGALYVADFYNKIIGHYEVPLTHPGRDRERGRIWRIIYKGAKDNAPAPAGPRADWTVAGVADLVDDLDHPNLTVRTKASNQLADRGGPEAVAAIRPILASAKSDPLARVHGLWVLQRVGALDEPTLAASAGDSEPIVRTHAQKVLSERPELTHGSRALVLAGLKDDDALTRRAAAEALGRHPDPANIRPLLELRRSVPADDTHLLHVARMALRDQLLIPGAFDSIPDATEHDARDLADVALGVPSAASAKFLLAYLEKYPEADARFALDARHVARHGGPELAPGLLALAKGATTVGRKVAVLKAIQQGTQERGGQLSPEARSWAVELSGQLLGSKGDGEVAAGVDLASTFRLGEAFGPIEALATSTATPEPRRLATVQALAAIDPARAVGPLASVLANASAPIGLREKTAEALAKTGRPEAVDRLVAALATSPGRLQSAIASGLASGRPGGEALLAALAAGKGSPRLLRERPVELKLKAAGVPDLDARLARLLEGVPAADAIRAELLDRRRATVASTKPDPEAGRVVYKKVCAACHQLGGDGGKVGPQLDGVGIRGVDRLLEDVLDPNRNVDQAFRTTLLALSDGQVVSGLLLREEGEVFVMADSAGREVRVPKAAVEERSSSQLSPMPANLADQIDESDFARLMSYLLGPRAVDPATKP